MSWLLFRAWIQRRLLGFGRITYKGMDKLCLTRILFAEFSDLLHKNHHSRKESWLVEVQGGSWEVVSLFWEISAVRKRKFYCLQTKNLSPPPPLTSFLSNLGIHLLPTLASSSALEQSPGTDLFVENTLRQFRVAKLPRHCQGYSLKRVVSRAQTPPPVDLSLPGGEQPALCPGRTHFPRRLGRGRS